MKIEIDAKSGFCFGVVNAIKIAEGILDKTGKLYCLGDIVHNNEEVQRLTEKGLITIDYEQFRELKNCQVLIRAHGEPPETYEIAKKNNIELVDASCRVVLKLQQNIKKGFEEIQKKDGQLVIYGKDGHAEVNGLVGQTNGKAIVVNSLSDLSKIDFTKPINLFSQTTQSRIGFADLKSEIKAKLSAEKVKDESFFHSNDTICRQVSGREPALKIFAQNYDTIIFVSGKKSSNGKFLYSVCKTANENTFFVSEAGELQKEWFSKSKKVGICGATSTPLWLMEKIAKEISLLKD